MIPKLLTRLISLGGKGKMWEPKVKPDKNVIKLEKPSAPSKHKMTPEELQDFFKANRGTGYHKNPADKRSSNPKRNMDAFD